MKNYTIIGIVVILILLAVGAYFVFNNSKTAVTPTEQVATTTETMATTTPVDKTKTVIGTSVQSRPITAYHYGTGDTDILLIGGIHGGYEWNTSLVAYEAMDYFKTNPSVIPANVRVTVIPVLNPDGLSKVVTVTDGAFKAEDVSKSTTDQVAGRFNANTVDLNRNFDCDWQAKGVWQDKTVSGGAEAFSEPESKAIKAYVEANKPDAVVVWYSSAGGVYASNCHDDVLAETVSILNLYSKASAYPAHASFDFYAITGDMVNWLAKNNIPAISVLLTNHTDTEWSKNKAGIDALLKHYAK